MKNLRLQVTPHLEKGRKNDVGCIFSCPGQEEEKEKRPAAKTTGDNLAKLFLLLNGLLDTDAFVRGDVTIANAWKDIEYKELTDRTEATSREIMDSKNLDRLQEDIRHVQCYLVCFGKKAVRAVKRLQRDGRLNRAQILEALHLAHGGLNRQIKHDIDGRPILAADLQKQQGDIRPKKTIEEENTAKRLAVVAQKLVEQIDLL